MKKLFILLFITVFFLPPLNADITLTHTAGNLLATQHGCMGFSASALRVRFRYPHGYNGVQAGNVRLLSGYAGALLNGRLHYAVIQTEYTAQDICVFGFRAGLFDAELEEARITVNTVEIREVKRLNRFYHTGFSFGIMPIKLRYSGEWYWGSPRFGLHDFGFFIAQPFFNVFATVQRLRITDWYECSTGFFKLGGSLHNKAEECIASGAGSLIVINNTVFIPVSEYSKFTVSASYLYFSGNFAVRLTAQNQGYFFFPYRFYNRDFSLTASAAGFGTSYSYQKDRIGLNGTLFFYSVVNSTSGDKLHSKEKKSIFFKGNEVRTNQTLMSSKDMHFLFFHFSFSYRFSRTAEFSIEKIAPIPILNSEQSQTLFATQPIVFDPLLSGLSFHITIQL